MTFKILKWLDLLLPFPPYSPIALCNNFAHFLTLSPSSTSSTTLFSINIESGHHHSCFPPDIIFSSFLRHRLPLMLLRSKYFRLQESPFLELPRMWGKSNNCREPVWGTPPMAKVMRKEARHMQRRDWASGDPLFPSIYPQNQSLPSLLLYVLTYTSDFMGGAVPHHLSCRRS